MDRLMLLKQEAVVYGEFLAAVVSCEAYCFYKMSIPYT